MHTNPTHSQTTPFISALQPRKLSTYPTTITDIFVTSRLVKPKLNLHLINTSTAKYTYSSEKNHTIYKKPTHSRARTISPCQKNPVPAHSTYVNPCSRAP